MTSKTSICNQALLSLGENTVTDVDADASTRAVVCRQFYDATRDALTRAFPWDFAKVRKELAQLSATPVYGYAYQYQLPTSPKCLRVLSVHDSTIEWVREGDKLLTDAETVKILYLAQIENTGQFDAMFTELLVARLSWRIAYPITRNRAKEAEQAKIYDDMLIDAQAIGSFESSLDDVDESDELIYNR